MGWDPGRHWRCAPRWSDGTTDAASGSRSGDNFRPRTGDTGKYASVRGLRSRWVVCPFSSRPFDLPGPSRTSRRVALGSCDRSASALRFTPDHPVDGLLRLSDNRESLLMPYMAYDHQYSLASPFLWSTYLQPK